MSKVNVVKTIETEDYKVLLQDVEGYLFLHCYVYNHKPSVMKQLKRLDDELLSWADSEDYDGIHAATENRKMARLIPGAKFIQDVEEHGKTVGLFKWELKQS